MAYYSVQYNKLMMMMMMIITYDNYNDDNYSITIVYAVYIQHIIHTGLPRGG